jgi:hypothetical protein
MSSWWFSSPEKRMFALGFCFSFSFFPGFVFWGRFYSASAEFLHLSEAYNGQWAGLLFFREDRKVW